MMSPRTGSYPQPSHWRRHLSRLMSEEDSSSQEVNVGRRLQELRQVRGLSQRALAEMSGLNFNTLSLIENEKTSPNVSTLQLLADALDVPITAFFETLEANMDVVYQKVSERPRISFPQGTLEDLGGGLALGEGTPLLMTLDPHTERESTALVHTGQEFVYCLAGEVVYWVDQTPYTLTPGDSLIFEAFIPHSWENQRDQAARLLMVICPTDQDDRLVTQHLVEPV